MAKQRKRPGKQPGHQKTQPPATPAESAESPPRRHALRRFRNGFLVVAGLGGAGWYVGTEVRAGIREADLSRIGNGIPTIVQIHDPQCPVCRALQTQARIALAGFGEGEVQYLVANIRQEKGKQLAAEHGVRHVTLLLLDGSGKRLEVLEGPNNSVRLEQAFRRHIDRARRG